MRQGWERAGCTYCSRQHGEGTQCVCQQLSLKTIFFLWKRLWQITYRQDLLDRIKLVTIKLSESHCLWLGEKYRGNWESGARREWEKGAEASEVMDNIQILSVRAGQAELTTGSSPRFLLAALSHWAPLISFDGLLIHLSLSLRSVVVFTLLGLHSHSLQSVAPAADRSLSILTILHC